jgi:hypothetical protein
VLITGLNFKKRFRNTSQNISLGQISGRGQSKKKASFFPKSYGNNPLDFKSVIV